MPKGEKKNREHLGRALKKKCHRPAPLCRERSSQRDNRYPGGKGAVWPSVRGERSGRVPKMPGGGGKTSKPEGHSCSRKKRTRSLPGRKVSEGKSDVHEDVPFLPSWKDLSLREGEQSTSYKLPAASRIQEGELLSSKGISSSREGRKRPPRAKGKKSHRNSTKRSHPTDCACADRRREAVSSIGEGERKKGSF